MKKTLLAAAVVVAAALLSLGFGCGSLLFAQAGCCKTRASYSAPWVRTAVSFPQCRTSNDQRDGDDVFAPSGFVWWDSQCR